MNVPPNEIGTVQTKLSCLFEIEVQQEPSGKRPYQSFRVTATDTLRQEAIEHDIYNARPSEKLDGTCVLISKFQDKPWLWARHDRKPTKQAERRFKAFQSKQKQGSKGVNSVERKCFAWNVEQDIKEAPANWKPFSGVEVIDGVPQPENGGHIPGWVPIDPSSRQHCWHLSAINIEKELALVLREDEANREQLEIVALPLAELDGVTAELIGTNINGNAYKIGTKQCPLHFLVVHGSLVIQDPPKLDLEKIRDWMASPTAGIVEGIVWHCKDKALFKLHRHHLELPWPTEAPMLCQRPVKISLDVENYSVPKISIQKQTQKDLFLLLGKLQNMNFDSLSTIHEHLGAL